MATSYVNDSSDHDINGSRHDESMFVITEHICYVSLAEFREIIEIIVTDLKRHVVEFYQLYTPFDGASIMSNDGIESIQNGITFGDLPMRYFRANIMANIITHYYRNITPQQYCQFLQNTWYTHGYLSNINDRQISFTIGTSIYREQNRITFRVPSGSHTKAASRMPRPI
jgi:hypothetical protein